MRSVFIQLCAILFVAIVFPTTLFAQNISVTKVPPYPKEGERVVLSVSSFVINLENALITWKQNNKTVLEGIGKTSFTVDNATNQTVTAEILDRTTNQKFTESVVLTTSQVDLLWEAVGSYTPPFYKGKALPALEANVNVVAIPKHPNISNLFYVWEKESARQVAQGGKGKNSFSYVATPLEQGNNISVNVSSDDGSFIGTESVVIRYGNSEVLFYEDDPTLGTLFNKTIKNGFNIGEVGEIALAAIPYFITSDSAIAKNLTMSWSLNGTVLPEQKVKNKVRLVGESGLMGSAVVSVFIKNSARLFEEGSVGLSLEF
jgi:hypothetical protein